VHVKNPAKDPHARYEVIHETAFEPASLEVGRVEVWLTESGEISIGFETVERVAKRLGVRAAKSGFAAGHEPQAMSRESLLALLDLVANGDVALHATIVPLIGISDVTAYTSATALARLAEMGYTATRWLRPREQRGDGVSLLQYQPWT
jgi:hypothetical protein